jgi:O-antigen ligase
MGKPSSPEPLAPGRERGLQLVVLSLLAAIVAASFVVLQPDLFHVDFDRSAYTLGALVVVLGLGWQLFAHPRLALPLLVLLVYLNLSQTLVRHQGLPSVLQLLMLPIAIVAWREGSWRELARRPPPLAVLSLAYGLVLLVSSTYAREPALADERIVETGKAILLFLLVVLLAATPARFLAAMWSAVGAATLLAALGLFQVATGDFDRDFGGLARVKNAQIYAEVFEPRIAGPLGDPNFVAQILLIAVPLAVSLAWGERRPLLRAAAWMCAGITAVGCAFTYSRGGTVALGAALVAFFAGRRPRLRDAVAVAVLAALVVALLPRAFEERLLTMTELFSNGEEVLDPDSSMEERRLFTATAWQLFRDHPWLGVGAGNYTAHYQETSDAIGSDSREYSEEGLPHYPHSLYLEIAAETGLLGTFTFAAIVVLSLWQVTVARGRLRRLDRPLEADAAAGVRAALVGYLVAAILLHGHFLRYLWLLFALVTAVDRLATDRDGRR